LLVYADYLIREIPLLAIIDPPDSRNELPQIGKRGVVLPIKQTAPKPQPALLVLPAQHATAHVPKVRNIPFLHVLLTIMLLSSMVMAFMLDVTAAKKKLQRAAQQVAPKLMEDYFEDIILTDELSFDERISTKEQESIREFFAQTPKDNEERMESIQRIYERSPQSLIQQVYRIISTTNKRQAQGARLAQAIVLEAMQQGYDPLFVAAVIKSESAFNELAVSNVGAQGLMQIMPATGKYLVEKHEPTWPTAVKLSDPKVNIKLGIRYLRELEGMYAGNRLLTLIAYNWGPGKLDRAIRSGRGVPAECLRYALKILKDHNYWETSAS
jgi:membrane-bound lytic murein transglycosylase MltF